MKMSTAEVALKKTKEILQRRNRDRRFLNRAVRVLNSILDLNRVLMTVLNEMSQMLRVVGGSIWLKDRNTGELVCLQSAGEQSDRVKGSSLRTHARTSVILKKLIKSPGLKSGPFSAFPWK